MCIHKSTPSLGGRGDGYLYILDGHQSGIPMPASDRPGTCLVEPTCDCIRNVGDRRNPPGSDGAGLYPTSGSATWCCWSDTGDSSKHKRNRETWMGLRYTSGCSDSDTAIRMNGVMIYVPEQRER
jgi:hypothetical protein